MKISIVIASGVGGNFLHKCLDSLYEQAKAHEAEIIIVNRCGEETAAQIERLFPIATLISVEPQRKPSIPELRRLGVLHASGDIVAVIEEHCIASPHWIETICTSFHEGTVAIGGPIVDNQYDRIQDWVVYFSEYHNYLPPWPEGKWYLLNGANIAYDRHKLMKYIDVLGSGYWEVVLHPLLTQEGDFRAVPRMYVHHTGPFSYGYYLKQRYLLSRTWGGTQREKISLMKRLIHLATAPILPFFLLARITQRVRQSGHNMSKLFTSYPLLFPVVCAYTLGEWMGYFLGAGNALEQVE